MPMKTFRRGTLAMGLLAAGIGLGLSGQALASCGLNNPRTFVPQDVQMDMGQVVILPSTPVGGIIKELVVGIDSRNSIASCDGSGGSAIGIFNNAAQQRAVANFSNVYATDVAGVGIRVYRNSGDIQTYYPHTLQLSRNTTLSLSGGSFRVQLIKTAAQTGSGSIAPTGRFTTYYYNGDGVGRPVLTSTFRATGTTVVSPTCEVDAGSRNIVVDFGSVPNSSFTGVGSRAVDRDFNITLRCQGSNVAQYQSTIGIQLDATSASGNQPGTLAITSGINSATRIGIQIVRRNGSSEQNITFGDSLMLGDTVSGTSSMSLPLRARYIQTQAGTVGAGEANGTATFTITYN
ncbi:MAG TPA: fimbrial protein [Stenotrophomonas sp.]|uniref:fimbrial protein n=1 Tax=unclassified Stenotrophomonas TaxID=196198 RepID=UPI000DE79D32|nr:MULTISPECIES: fimbrial protein [unclassified Stenotrophomonas]PWB29523.1 fimbrial protein [Stenotrophomonas sp. SPM]HCR33923.1 fimbrial protein [Stenotrophomonas sp.]